jgi:hypothetical protein
MGKLVLEPLHEPANKLGCGKASPRATSLRKIASHRRLAEHLPYVGCRTVWSRTLGSAFWDRRLCIHLRDDIVERGRAVIEKPLEAFERRMEAAAW